MQSMLADRVLTAVRGLVGRQAPGLGWMGDGENVWDKIAVWVRVRMHLTTGVSVAMVVVWSMLMSVSKDQKRRWNATVEVARLAGEESGKMPMQNQTTDTQALPKSKQMLAVVVVVVEEREYVGMESKEQVAVLSNGVVDIQGIRE